MSYGELPIRYVRTFEAGGKSVRSDYYNPPPEPYSYEIYKEGGLIKAKNGRTGQVEFSGTDATWVIQSALDSLPSTGGRVLIKSGIYEIDGTITLNRQNSLIEGEAVGWFEPSQGAVIKASDEFPSGHIMLRLNKPFNHVRHLFFDGNNKKALTAIHLASGDSSVEYCSTFKCINAITAYNFHLFIAHNWIEFCDYGLYLSGAYQIVVHANIISENTYNIWIEGTVHDIRILGNEINAGVHGLYQKGTLSHSIIAYNNFRKHTSEAIYITGDVSDTLIYANILNGLNTTKSFIVTDAASTVNNSHVRNNLISSVTSSPFVENGGVFNKKFNIGYVTENSGTATFSGDGATTTFTIPHGLVSTPTTYYVEAASADAAGDKYVTADDTNLIVTFSAAPPSGADNIVLKWKAEV